MADSDFYWELDEECRLKGVKRTFDFFLESVRKGRNQTQRTKRINTYPEAPQRAAIEIPPLAPHCPSSLDMFGHVRVDSDMQAF